jgi:hypothetical protein
MGGPSRPPAPSDHRPSGAPPEEPTPPIGKHLEGLSALYDPRQLRSRWLADLSQLTSGYLRSRAFLELMKLNLRAMTKPNPFV